MKREYMNWFKITTDDGKDKHYTYVGKSSDTLDTLGRKASRGEYICLTELLYWDKEEVKSWSDWDKSIIPTVYINPAKIYSMVQFKGDPRVTPFK